MTGLTCLKAKLCLFTWMITLIKVQERNTIFNVYLCVEIIYTQYGLSKYNLLILSISNPTMFKVHKFHCLENVCDQQF